MRSKFAAVGSSRYTAGTSGIGCRCWLMFLTRAGQRLLLASQHISRRVASVYTYRCTVMPNPRKSLTRSTLLITSLPRLSNTSTFHIGSPSAFRMGVDCGMSPFVTAASLPSWGTSFRLSTRLMAATAISMVPSRVVTVIPTYLSVPQRLIGRHVGWRSFVAAMHSLCQ